MIISKIIFNNNMFFIYLLLINIYKIKEKISMHRVEKSKEIYFIYIMAYKKINNVK